MSLTQYLKSQEDQDMTRSLYFTRTQERKRKEGFCVPWNGREEEGLYSCNGKNMNERSFNEG